MAWLILLIIRFFILGKCEFSSLFFVVSSVKISLISFLKINDIRIFCHIVAVATRSNGLELRHTFRVAVLWLTARGRGDYITVGAFFAGFCFLKNIRLKSICRGRITINAWVLFLLFDRENHADSGYNTQNCRLNYFKMIFHSSLPSGDTRFVACVGFTLHF